MYSSIKIDHTKDFFGLTWEQYRHKQSSCHDAFRLANRRIKLHFGENAYDIIQYKPIKWHFQMNEDRLLFHHSVAPTKYRRELNNLIDINVKELKEKVKHFQILYRQYFAQRRRTTQTAIDIYGKNQKFIMENGESNLRKVFEIQSTWIYGQEKLRVQGEHIKKIAKELKKAKGDLKSQSERYREKIQTVVQSDESFEDMDFTEYINQKVKAQKDHLSDMKEAMWNEREEMLRESIEGRKRSQVKERLERLRGMNRSREDNAMIMMNMEEPSQEIREEEGKNELEEEAKSD